MKHNEHGGCLHLHRLAALTCSPRRRAAAVPPLRRRGGLVLLSLRSLARSLSGGVLPFSLVVRPSVRPSSERRPLSAPFPSAHAHFPIHSVPTESLPFIHSAAHRPHSLTHSLTHCLPSLSPSSETLVVCLVSLVLTQTPSGARSLHSRWIEVVRRVEASEQQIRAAKIREIRETNNLHFASNASVLTTTNNNNINAEVE